MNQAIHTTTASGIKTLMASHSIWQDGMSKVRGNLRDRVEEQGGHSRRMRDGEAKQIFSFNGTDKQNPLKAVSL